MSDTPEITRKSGWRLTLLELLLVIFAIALVAAFLMPAIQRARDAARRSQARNSLKQLGLALHNYHDAYKTLPPGGVFDAKGVPNHCWTTFMDPYLASSPWYSQVNFTIPWDDPIQVDLFKARRYQDVWKNPRVAITPRSDGVPQAEYAANSWLMHRNSSINFDKIGDLQSTLLVAESRGNYLPLGCPGNWRDVAEGFNKSDDSFGCPGNVDIQILLADGSVRTLEPDLDPGIWNALAGPRSLEPTAAHRLRPPYLYVFSTVPYWRKRLVVFGKGINASVQLRLSPDGLTLLAEFHRSDDDQEVRRFDDAVNELIALGDIRHVKLAGQFQAGELDVFTRIPNLKTLTISQANIQGDLPAFRARLSPQVVVD